MKNSLILKYNWYRDRLLSEFFLKKVQLKARKKPKSSRHHLPQKLIISLTSYKPRFATLEPTILSFIQQNVCPDAIILWVAEEDYPFIPESILNLQGPVNDQGTQFEIKITRDTGPYKKIIPNLQINNNQFILTADDDIYYPSWWLQNLLQEYTSNNHEIICYLAHQIHCSGSKVLPYNEWSKNKNTNVDPLLGFAVGAGGVLYPPNSLHPSVTDEETFLKYSPMADDIWLFWMARMQGSTTKKTKRYFRPICWPKSQKVGLLNVNVSNHGNDKKIQNMVEAFGWPINQKQD